MASSRPNSQPASPAVFSPRLDQYGNNSTPINLTTRPITASPVNSPPTSPSRQPIQPVPSPAPDPRRTSTANTFATTRTRPEPEKNPRPEYKRGRLSSKNHSSYYKRLSKAFSPSTHDLKDYSDVPPQGRGRPYLHHQQRNRLLGKTIGEFIITLLLCLTYWAVLFGYHFSNGLNKSHRRWFNALVTANALVLGVNLSNSLRSYAKMLRWRMLASKYRSLRKFDLILGCDSLWNVVKLLKYERSKKNRLPVNTMAQIYCIMWLVMQAGIALCVGIIGLTYTLDVSDVVVFTKIGNTSVVDLSSLSTGAWLNDLAAINVYGIRGDNSDGYVSPNLLYKDSQGSGTYLSNEDGHTRYFFIDSAADNTQEQDVSQRYIDAITSCISFPITKGMYGNKSQITYTKNGKDVNQTIFQQPGVAGLYAQGDTNSTCGDRCTNIMVFQAAIPPDQADAYYNSPYPAVLPYATRFECNCSVTDVKDSSMKDNLADPVYQIPALISKMLAGAFAWSDNALKEDRYMYVTYPAANEISFIDEPSAIDVSNKIAEYTMSGIVAMDDTSGLPRQYIINGQQPIQAQVLHVKWRFAGALLAIIPFVQFWTMLIVIKWGNKTIIKDDSSISVARIYHSLLDKMNGRGCILDGDQLIESLGNPRVAYAYDKISDSIYHVDVYKDTGQIKLDRRFPEGEYDGTHEAHQGDQAKSRGSVVDAYAYF